MVSATPTSTWSALAQFSLNAAIATLLALILIDAFTPLAPYLPRAIQPVMQATGLAQGQWSMFAPSPDTVNARIRAEIDYADGQHVTWRSPVWSQLSPAERFVTNRRLEYFDAVIQPHNTAVWDDFARYLVQSQCPAGSTAKGTRIELWIEEALILNPDEEGWQPWGPPEYGPPTLIYDRNYP